MVGDLNKLLSAIEARCEAASFPPWKAVRSLTCGHLRAEHNYDSANPKSEWTDEDIDFISHARADIPRLIAAIRVLEKGLRQCCVCDVGAGYKDGQCPGCLALAAATEALAGGDAAKGEA